VKIELEGTAAQTIVLGLPGEATATVRCDGVGVVL